MSGVQGSLDKFGVDTPEPLSDSQNHEEDDSEKRWPVVSKSIRTSRGQMLPLSTEGSINRGRVKRDWYQPSEDEWLGLTVSAPKTRKVEKRFDLPPSGDFVAVLDTEEAVTSFLDTHAVRELSYPETYTEIDDRHCQPILSRITVGEPRGHGLGLSRHRLKGILRLTNRKGRINESRTKLYECLIDGELRYLAAGMYGIYIIEPTSVSVSGGLETEQALSKIVHTTDNELLEVAGQRIPEENERYQRGIRNAVGVIEWSTNYTVKQHRQLSTHSHHFDTEQGIELRLSRRTIEKFAEMRPDRESVLGQYNVSTNTLSRPIPITDQDVSTTVGGTVSTYNGKNQVIVGYRTKKSVEDSSHRRKDQTAELSVVEYLLDLDASNETVRVTLRTREAYTTELNLTRTEFGKISG